MTLEDSISKTYKKLVRVSKPFVAVDEDIFQFESVIKGCIRAERK